MLSATYFFFRKEYISFCSAIAFSRAIYIYTTKKQSNYKSRFLVEGPKLAIAIAIATSLREYVAYSH